PAATCTSPVALPVAQEVPPNSSAGSAEVKPDPNPTDSSTAIPWALGLGLAVVAAVVVTRIIGRRGPVAVHVHRYVEFDLDIGKASGGGYPVRVVHSPAGEAQTTAHPPKLDVELERSLGQGRDIEPVAPAAGERHLEPVAPGAGERQTAKAFGQALFEAVFNGPVRTVFDTTRAQARLGDAGVRIKLRVNAPELARLPWELLYDAHEPGFLGLSRT